MPLPQNIVPAMQAAGATPSPAPAPAPEAAPAAPAMDHKSMVADLESKAADIQNKNNALEAKKITNQNIAEDMRMQILQDLFEIMKQKGVDPANQESVKEFLEKLAEEDPDLFEIFEIAFNNLSAMPGEGQSPAPAADQGLMGKFNNLAPGMMMGENAAPAPEAGMMPPMPQQ